MNELILTALGQSTKNIVALSLVNETIISEIKKIFKDKKLNWEAISIGTGMAFSVIFGQNLFKDLGFNVALVGISQKYAQIFTTLITGFLISRGSNIIYKIINIIDIKKEEMELRIAPELT